MKSLIISFSLTPALLIGQSALAQEDITPLVEPIETIVVVAKPEVANFEIYSVEITKTVLNSTMNLIRDDISASIVNSAVSLLKADLDQQPI